MERVIQFLEENDYQNYKVNEPLKNHSTMRVGGNAALLFMPKNTTEIVNVIKFLFKEDIPYKIIGNGSNTLFSDNFYDGVIIKNTKCLSYLHVDGESVVVGSSYPLVKLAYDLANLSLTGFEFAGGIPGTVGGAIYMNAGAYNVEMKDIIDYVTFIDVNGEVITLKKDELEMGYRTSIFKQLEKVLILEAKINLNKGDKEDSMAILKKRKQRRLHTQPLKYPSCGSTFKNPEGAHAWSLIDQVGLRGYRIGGAKFSEKHCNFIINFNDAKASDVKDLINLAKMKVYSEYNVELTPEIEFFNW